MNATVLSSLIPILLLIATGYVAARQGWMRAAATKDMTALVFNVLTPALLFRTMSAVHLDHVDFRPAAVYFAAAALMFAAMLGWMGITRRASALALGASFSNTVAIGIPLISLAYGEAAMVTLLTLISLHSLILLTLATVVFEVAVAHEKHQAGGASSDAEGGQRRRKAVLDALRGGIFHPVPLPILAGLLFAWSGLTLPAVIDRPLMLLGNAMGPMALIIVGASLSGARIGKELPGALGLTLLKNLVLPALVAGLGLLLGLRGLPLTVMVVTASLPMGANVFMFSQRYDVAQELISASMILSTALAIVTVSLVMGLVPLL